MNFEKPSIPSAKDAKRLKIQNKAYTEGMKELNNMSSIHETEKSEVREMISDKVQENYEKQQGVEKSPLVKDIEQRANQASEKIKERVMSRFIPSILAHKDRGEFWLHGLRNDFYHLAKNPNHPTGGGNYDNWTADEIKGLYFVLYNENLDE